MCAALQHASSSGRPVLLRGERDVGHGLRALSRGVDLLADTFAFVASHLGLWPPGDGAAPPAGTASSERSVPVQRTAR